MNLAIEEIKVSGEAMNDAIRKMIDSNKDIAFISRDLTEVSLQTKILAINAGVEAVHAGKYGATFAVVADQVKTVAEQCHKASERADTAIRNSVSVSEAAIKLGQRVEANIQKILLFQHDVAEVLTRLAARAVNDAASAPDTAADKPLAYDAPTMSTGVKLVDDQHRSLFAMINQLEQAAQQGKGRGEVDGMLDFLGDYVQKHFAAEEAIMEARRCPAAEKNKKAHAALIDTYVQWRKKYESEGARLSLVMDLKSILSQWLVSHICGVDRCLNQEAGGKPGVGERKSARADTTLSN